MESKFESIWVNTTPSTNYPSLNKSLTTDICVIGGGLAGIVTAYLLTKKGRKTTLIEALKIGTGTTGYTTAKVTSMHEAKYSYLLSKFGKKSALIYAQSNQWAIEELEKIINKEKIKCDFSRADCYLYTLKKGGTSKLKEEFKAAKKIGLPASYVTDIPSIPFKIKGAVQFKDQAIFHPRKFLLALAKVIIKNNGSIFENTRATKIKNGIVITEKGNIKAKEIVIATNYPFHEKAVLSLRMNQRRSYAIACKVEDKISKDMFIGLEHNEPTIRQYKNKYLIFGGEDHPVGDDEDTIKHYKDLEKEVRKLYKIKSIDYKWAAQDSSPIDNVPYIGKLPFSNNLYVITGFNEWGMTTSFVSAKLITDLIIKRENPWEELYKLSRVKPFASPKKVLEIGKQVVKGFSGYVTKNEDLNKIKPGGGKVITYKGKKIAVSKDENGKLSAVSAVCTHLGCIVGWNNSEQTWDCPCHGSRFDKTGEVIHGPAAKNLANKKLNGS